VINAGIVQLSTEPHGIAKLNATIVGKELPRIVNQFTNEGFGVKLLK